jgi:hypothetical protein
MKQTEYMLNGNKVDKKYIDRIFKKSLKKQTNITFFNVELANKNEFYLYTNKDNKGV